MWCANCQADVAAEVTAHNGTVRCAVCGAEIDAAHALRTAPKTEQARKLLERWSNSELLDPFGPVARVDRARIPDAPEVTTPQPVPQDEQPSSKGKTSATESPISTDEATPDETIAVAKRKRRFHFDGPHTPHSESSPVRTGRPADAKDIQAALEAHAATAQDNPANPTAAAKPQSSATIPAGSGASSVTAPRVHESHGERMPRPHIDLQAVIETDGQQKGNWTALVGQLMAYGGVGTMTIGTVLVLWGYFGGPESYAPTGWLVTTAGQMLLFLGVVTLVSGGMEQTTDEVTRRIERLGEKIVRIEQFSREQAARGPSIPAPHFGTRSAQPGSASPQQGRSAEKIA